MHRVRRALIAFYLAVPLGIHGQGTSAARARTERPLATPLTVCESLESADQYAGKVSAVVGRLSSDPFDGAWLSENGCDGKVPPSDPHWPYAVFLSCYGNTRPNPGEGQPDIDCEALKATLDHLRQTTRLGYDTSLIVPRSGETPQRPQLVVYQRHDPFQAAAIPGAPVPL